MGSNATPMERELKYFAPYHWGSVLSFFRNHHLPYLESVDEKGYERVVDTARGTGWFRVEHDKSRRRIRLSLWNGTEADLERISAAVSKMFDLDVRPNVVRAAMSADASLSAMWSRYPGLRVARAWSPFEAFFTTVLGQVVSVAFGRVLIGELMKAAGTKSIHPKTAETIHLFPTAEQILAADLSSVRTSEARRATIRSLAQMVESGTLDWKSLASAKASKKMLLSVPGVGSWTAEYIAMRAFKDDDAFPATDYGLRQELRRRPQLEVDRTRPFRAYAATVLWRSFAEEKKKVPKPLLVGG